MRTTERDAKAAPLLKARIEAATRTLDPITTFDEYGNEWEVVSVEDDGSVLTGQSIYVDGEDYAGNVMDDLDPNWDSDD